MSKLPIIKITKIGIVIVFALFFLSNVIRGINPGWDNPELCKFLLSIEDLLSQVVGILLVLMFIGNALSIFFASPSLIFSPSATFLIICSVIGCPGLQVLSIPIPYFSSKMGRRFAHYVFTGFGEGCASRKDGVFRRSRNR